MLENAAILNELNKAFDKANERWWDGQLPTPMIIVSRKSSKWEYGFITVNKVWVEKKPESNGEEEIPETDTKQAETRYEINISAEGLNRPIEEILATLVHECVHLYCQENGIKDCSQKIHNKNFKREAEKADLIVERGQGVGYGYTSPSEAFIEEVKLWGIDEEPFKFVRTEIIKPAPKKKGRWKYEDPNNEKRKFICKYEIVVTDPETGTLWDSEYEEGDEDD